MVHHFDDSEIANLCYSESDFMPLWLVSSKGNVENT